MVFSKNSIIYKIKKIIQIKKKNQNQNRLEATVSLAIN